MSQFVLSTTGKHELSVFLQRSQTLLAFDFDGTLSPIVQDPDAARLDPKLLPLLSSLAERSQLCLITGRSLADIQPRVPHFIHEIIGNHGAEWAGVAFTERCKKLEADVQVTFEALKEILPPEPGLVVEKKNLSLSLHFRHVRDPAETEAVLRTCVSRAAADFRVIAGKSVLSLTPPGVPHKGDALLELMQKKGLTQALYVGDDVTDEDVFCLRAPHVFGIKIGAPDETLAQYYIHEQNQMGDLICLIRDALPEA